MQKLTELLLQNPPPGGLFDEAVLVNLFPDATPDARRQVLFRAVAHQEVLRLKPGLYCLAPPYRRSTLHPFVVAAVLHSPSHVSFESALSFHDFIPEAVRMVTSATTQRSRVLKTPLGDFSFRRVPCIPLRAGVEAHHFEQGGWAFVARPLRAVLDLLYVRSDVSWGKGGSSFLRESLRFDDEGMAALAREPWDEVVDEVRNNRVRRYLRELRKEVARRC